ncbi:MAG: hypothetical protein M3R02_01940 [Chloroflexota bacterium]|nr:hypothetical protein [Chloroflexota bacterium]
MITENGEPVGDLCLEAALEIKGREGALTPDDTPLTCQAAVREPPYARRNVRWHPCPRRSRVEVIHHQDGRPIALCRQHAKIHADLFTPITRREPKAEGIAPPTTQGCAQD